MLFTEPTVSLTCLFLAAAYGMFYMLFESIPIIFGRVYGFSAGEQGLVFLPGEICSFDRSHGAFPRLTLAQLRLTAFSGVHSASGTTRTWHMHRNKGVTGL